MINVTFDAPSWVDINRGKQAAELLNETKSRLDRLLLLAAYQIHESTGAFIERMEADNEGQRPKAKTKVRRAKR